MPKASQGRYEKLKAQSRHPEPYKSDADAGKGHMQRSPLDVSLRIPLRQRRDAPLTPTQRADRLEKIKSIVNGTHEPQRAEATSLAPSAPPIFGPPPPPKGSNFEFIGPDPHLHALMSRHRLSWAVRWEVTRYHKNRPRIYQLSLDEWKDIFDELRRANLATRTELNQPDGSNTEARQIFPQIQTMLRKRCPSNYNGSGGGELDATSLEADVSKSEAKDPYVELDFEEKAILAGSDAGLGLSDNSPNGPGWYGGQVAQCVTLMVQPKKKNHVATKKPTTDQFALVLAKHKIAPSTRVARKFGSRRILQCSISSEAKQSGALLDFFLKKKFVLNGRIFEAIYAKEATVYLLETGTYSGGGQWSPLSDNLSNNGRMTLEQFINWHNSIKFNSQQVISKWSARFSLGFSASIPVCRFYPHNILEIKDICHGGGEHAWQVMTDGCGFMNRKVAVQIQQLLDLEYLPTAIQARVGGVKGVFILDPSPEENAIDQPRLRCRPSQIKIRHGEHTFVTSEPSQLILDLLRTSQPKMPANLSKEVIACLGHGGVTADILEPMLCQKLDEKFAPLTTWDGEDANIRLWRAIFDLQRVLQSRLRNETAGSSRVWGYGESLDIAQLGLELGLEDENGPEDMSDTWIQELLSRLPAGLAEQVLQFLIQGFHPRQAPILREKLDRLIMSIVENFIEKYRLEIDQSFEALAAPDPLGILEHGQVYFRRSTPWQNRDGTWSDTIIGHVLVTRHPCKVASDVQKFLAVDCPELRNWPDVMIFSTKSPRSPVSLLGGGDFDGDTVIAISEPKIVEAFRNAPLRRHGRCRGDPDPGFIEASFDKSVKRLDEVVLKERDFEILLTELQTALLAQLANRNVAGMYSIMHEKATLKYGYDALITVQLAWKFCLSLDGPKAGLTIKPSVKYKDKDRFDKYSLPQSREKKKAVTHPKNQNTNAREVSPVLKISANDIIAHLWRMGREKGKEYRKTLNDPKRGGGYYDPDLSEPYNSACKRAKESVNPLISELMIGDIEKIKQIVNRTWNEYDKRLAPTDLTWKQQREIIDSVASKLKASIVALRMSVPMAPSEKEKIAASYAYVMDMELYNSTHDHYASKNKGTSFPFDVMFTELGNIKAQSRPNSISIPSEFAGKLVVHRSFLRKH